jgi:hypothetical protein
MGMDPWAVMASEFEKPEFVGPYNAPLTSIWENNYIRSFAIKAQQFASNTMTMDPGSGLNSYIVWNEPNDTAKARLETDRFAALMHETFASIKSVSSLTKVYMGGHTLAGRSR